MLMRNLHLFLKQGALTSLISGQFSHLSAAMDGNIEKRARRGVKPSARVGAICF